MRDNNWISMHIFYHTSANPLLVECVKPLVDVLFARGLIQRYFFIKYWQEGPHVRLRLLPATHVTQDAVKHFVEPVLTAYLQQRPSLLPVDAKSLQPIYRSLFEVEYGAEKWIEAYGEQGDMPVRDNNSFDYIDYEPEYARYGGVAGVELAEWHFEQSSNLVLQLLKNMNVHIHTVLLGLSAQLMLHFSYGFLKDDQKAIAFFESYINYWQSNYSKSNRTFLEKKPQLWMNADLQQIVAKIHRATISETAEELTTFERAWYAHIQELRNRIRQLVEEEKLVFAFPGSNEPGRAVDLDTTYLILLHGYVHMTNNRLGANILDETYLAQILKRCLLHSVLAKEEVIP